MIASSCSLRTTFRSTVVTAPISLPEETGDAMATRYHDHPTFPLVVHSGEELLEQCRRHFEVLGDHRLHPGAGHLARGIARYQREQEERQASVSKGTAGAGQPVRKGEGKR